MPFSKAQSAPARNATRSVAGGKRKAQSQKFKVQKGFTLIELLVVMAIIGILSTIMLANYNNFGARQEVRNAAAELKSNLRKYQTFALASQKDPIQNGACLSNPINHYGFEIGSTIPATPPDRYRAFLDCSLATPVYLPWVDLTQGLEIRVEDSNSPPNLCTTFQLRFLPLNQQLTLTCNGGGSGNDLFILVTDGTNTETVRISSSGEIQ